ncbi:MAG: GNAT family N-acetyltransferase [Anaerolineae bacterium]|nr:GNAT family N-acetyltransferase [Anaerolineae bacterium]MDW8173617.1 GNAT family N-acetyltransferase [Anaerolineae bacterium]
MSQATPDTLITTTLEMTNREQFRPAFLNNLGPEVQIVRLQAIDVDFYLKLYKGVGWELRWRDRLIMPRHELRAALERALIYVLLVDGQPAGYIELDVQGHDVEVAYFGLFAEYQGHGLGKHLLSYGLEQAWSVPGVQRVWVHTCNLDGPHALSNYEKRGFRVVMRHSEPMPERYKS